MPSARDLFFCGPHPLQQGGPRRFPKGDRKALWSPPQRRNLLRNRKKPGRLFSLPSTGYALLVESPICFKRWAPEGVQGASGKPPGRLRRGETFCDTGESKIGSFPCLAQENCFLWEVSSACGRTRYFPTRESTQRVPGAAKGCMSRGRPRTPRC